MADSRMKDPRAFRKGTRNCFECRRRKTKCTRIPKSNSCYECQVRKLKCISQEAALPKVVSDGRKTVRKRLAEVEAIIGSLMQEIPAHRDSYGGYNAPEFGHVSRNRAHDKITAERAQQQVPLAFEQEISYSNPNPSSKHQQQEDMLAANHFNISSSPHPSGRGMKEEKDSLVCKALRAVLPEKALVYRLLHECSPTGSMLRNFSGKCGPASSFSKESLEEALSTQTDPTKLAAVLQSIAACGGAQDYEEVVSTVDRLIIRDEEYLRTLEGLRCAFTQCHLYLDAGQAQRSWELARHAITAAVIIGIHKYRSSVQEDVIWLQLYHSDRFLSLMLGLPYSIADSHCSLAFRGQDLLTAKTPRSLTIRLAHVAGKIIDQTQQTNPAPAVSTIFALDKELDECISTGEDSLWQVDSTPPKDDTLAQLWAAKTFSQLIYYQIKAILHAPHMLRSAKEIQTPQDQYIRDECFVGARGVLRVYYKLRSPMNLTSYKNMAIDYIATVAASLLLLRLGGYGGTDLHHQDEADWKLIDITIDTLKRMSIETNSHVATQGYVALERLVRFRSPDDLPSADCQVLIPFFGTISIQRDRLLRRFESSQSGEMIPVAGFYEAKLKTGFPELSSSRYMPRESFVQYDGVYSYQRDNSLNAWMSFGMDIDLDWDEISKNSRQ